MFDSASAVALAVVGALVGIVLLYFLIYLAARVGTLGVMKSLQSFRHRQPPTYKGN